jgi:hypothetical protein
LFQGRFLVAVAQQLSSCTDHYAIVLEMSNTNQLCRIGTALNLAVVPLSPGGLAFRFNSAPYLFHCQIRLSNFDCSARGLPASSSSSSASSPPLIHIYYLFFKEFQFRLSFIASTHCTANTVRFKAGMSNFELKAGHIPQDI